MFKYLNINEIFKSMVKCYYYGLLKYISLKLLYFCHNQKISKNIRKVVTEAFIMHKIQKFLLVLFALSILTSCSMINKDKKTEETEGDQIIKKKRINPNASERAKEARDKGLILFGKKVGESGVVSFANSNVLWRASLEVLDFMPLETVDYAGGIISTDWYKKDNKNNEEIKIRVQFLSNELSPSSIKVISHKRICLENQNCKIVKTNISTLSKIKKAIIAEARKIKIEDEKKNKK